MLLLGILPLAGKLALYPSGALGTLYKEEPMPEPPERESVSLEDLVYSNMVQIEAITRLLVEKGVITPEELIDEVKAVHAEQHKKAGGVGIS